MATPVLIFGVIAGPSPLVITVKWEDEHYAHLIQGASQRLTYHPTAVKRLVNARRASLRDAPISIRGTGLTRLDVSCYYDFDYQEFVFRGQLLISELQEIVWFSQFSNRQRIAIERRRQTLARRNELRREEERLDREQEARNQLADVQAGLVRGRPRGRRALSAEELQEREEQLAEDRREYERLRAEQEAAYQNRLNRSPNSSGSGNNNGQHAGGTPPVNQANRQSNNQQPVQQANRADRIRALVSGERSLGQHRANPPNQPLSSTINQNRDESMNSAERSGLSNQGDGNGSRELLVDSPNGSNGRIHSLDTLPDLTIHESDLAGAAAQPANSLSTTSGYSTPVTRRSDRLNGNAHTGLTDLIRQLPFTG